MQKISRFWRAHQVIPVVQGKARAWASEKRSDSRFTSKSRWTGIRDEI
ncbi:hypothetical protein ACWM35_09680 [Neobacillus sp. K501]